MKGLLAGAGLLSIVLAGAGAFRAEATPPGQNGVLVFTCGENAHREGSQVYLEGICVTTADGRQTRRLDDDPVPFAESDGGDSQPAWSPDGQQIAWIRTLGEAPGGRVREVFVMNADGSGKRQLTTLGQYAGSPAWSPDGTRIAFEAPPGLFVVEASGGEPKLVVADAFGPTWSPDGKRLAFVGTRGQLVCTPTSSDVVLCSRATELHSVNADGTDRRLVSNTPRLDFRAPSWSPDGGSLAVECGGEICVVPADGGEPRRLNVSGSFPSWSPDGRKIAFSRKAWFPTAAFAGRAEAAVCTVDIDGGNATRVASGEDPDWQALVVGITEPSSGQACPSSPQFRPPELLSLSHDNRRLTARFGSLAGVEAATVTVSTQPHTYVVPGGWSTSGTQHHDSLTSDEITAGTWTSDSPLDPGRYFVRTETRDWDCLQICIAGSSGALSVEIPEPTLRFTARAKRSRDRRALLLSLRVTPLGKNLPYRVCWPTAKGRRCRGRVMVGTSWSSGLTDVVRLPVRGLRPATRFVWYVDGKAVGSRTVKVRLPDRWRSKSRGLPPVKIRTSPPTRSTSRPSATRAG
jgi:Tol biopolymer transport system component